MSTVVDWFRDQTHRAYVYRVLNALSALLVVAGVATDGSVQLAMFVASTILGVSGTGLATGNTSTKREP